MSNPNLHALSLLAGMAAVLTPYNVIDRGDFYPYRNRPLASRELKPKGKRHNKKKRGF